VQHIALRILDDDGHFTDGGDGAIEDHELGGAAAGKAGVGALATGVHHHRQAHVPSTQLQRGGAAVLQRLRLDGRHLGWKAGAAPTGTEQQGHAKTKDQLASRKMEHGDRIQKQRQKMGARLYFALLLWCRCSHV